MSDCEWKPDLTTQLFTLLFCVFFVSPAVAYPVDIRDVLHIIRNFFCKTCNGPLAVFAKVQRNILAVTILLAVDVKR